MMFIDRFDAALKLIPYLEKYRNEYAVIFAIPGGGVPLGFYLAKDFNFPMELLLTKKIGHPKKEDISIGSVSLENHFIDERLNIPESYIKSEVSRIRKWLKERQVKFLGDYKPSDLTGRTVILVDDGASTGNTLLAAIGALRKKNPKCISVAVPVAKAESANKIKQAADDFHCLMTPGNFIEIGHHYLDYSKVSDAEVIQLMKGANRTHTTAA